MDKSEEINPYTDRLKAILVERLGWCGRTSCPTCGKQAIHTVLDSFDIRESSVKCPNGHDAVSGDLGPFDADAGSYRNLFQDGMELAAMCFEGRTALSVGMAVVLAHTAFEVFLRAVIQHKLKSLGTAPEVVRAVLDDRRPDVSAYIRTLRTLGVVEDEKFLNSLREVSDWRNDFVHRGCDCSADDAVRAFEKIAELFVRLGGRSSAP